MTKFWEYVQVGTPAECWPWMRARMRKGYGVSREGLAHRIAYRISCGPIPKAMFVCHSCDNPPCCNPKHLFLGTPKDNSQDAARKNRFPRTPRTFGASHHRSTAKLTPDQVMKIRKVYYPDGLTHRQIAECLGISRENVGQIVRENTWRHLCGE